MNQLVAENYIYVFVNYCVVQLLGIYLGFLEYYDVSYIRCC